MKNGFLTAFAVIAIVIAAAAASSFLSDEDADAPVVTTDTQIESDDTSSADTETPPVDADTATTDEAGSVESVDPAIASGLTELGITDVAVGEGAEAPVGGTVKVHYRGTLASDGTQFDSSYDRGEPAEFPLANVIVGWQEGIPGMKVGGTRRLEIPAVKAYGASGRPGIPANSDLIFEVELIEVIQ